MINYFILPIIISITKTISCHKTSNKIVNSTSCGWTIVYNKKLKKTIILNSINIIWILFKHYFSILSKILTSTVVIIITTMTTIIIVIIIVVVVVVVIIFIFPWTISWWLIILLWSISSTFLLPFVI